MFTSLSIVLFLSVSKSFRFFKSDIHLNSTPRFSLLKIHCAVHGYLTDSHFGIALDVLQLTDAIDDLKLSFFWVNQLLKTTIKTSPFFNVTHMF